MSKALVISTGKNHSLELNHAQNEFKMLLHEIDLEVVEFFSQNIESIDKGTYIGVGKLQEVGAFFHQYNEEHPDNPLSLTQCQCCTGRAG